MADPHCRIGRFTLKESGFTVERMADKPAATLSHDLKKCAETMVSVFKPHGPERLAGYAIVAWAANGEWSRGFRMTEASPWGVTTMPDYVASVLRRATVSDVIDEVFGFPKRSW